jgi:hypothetical protein
MMETPAEVDHSALLHLIDPAGAVAAVWNLSMSADWWSSTQWIKGDRWIGQHVIRIPQTVEGGTYTLSAGHELCDQSLAEAQLDVREINRIFEIPENYDLVDVDFGDLISLAGFEVSKQGIKPGESFDVNLVWRAIAETPTSYRVFLHLVDNEGLVINQDDGEPANWTRPTTGWVKDEVVTEVRSLTVPKDAAGQSFTIQVGLYTEDGVRLLRANGQDSFELLSFDVDNN